MTWWSRLLFTLLFFGGIAYLLVIFNWSYSDGDRVGYLQKLSRKGWVCKTQEGELAMTTVPGVAPLLWNFTVWDETVAKKLDGQMGRIAPGHHANLVLLDENLQVVRSWIGGQSEQAKAA